VGQINASVVFKYRLRTFLHWQFQLQFITVHYNSSYSSSQYITIPVTVHHCTLQFQLQFITVHYNSSYSSSQYITIPVTVHHSTL